MKKREMLQTKKKERLKIRNLIILLVIFLGIIIINAIYIPVGQFEGNGINQSKFLILMKDNWYFAALIWILLFLMAISWIIQRIYEKNYRRR